MKIHFFYLFNLLLLSSLYVGCNSASDNKTSDNKDSTNQNGGVKITAINHLKSAVKANANAEPTYYDIRLEPVGGATQQGLQSFAMGSFKNDWVFIGGRTNGFHGTDGTNPHINFPVKTANPYIVVANVENEKVNTWRVLPPKSVREQFRSTNIAFYDDGEVLYLAGGYGQNDKGEYVTYPQLTAINLPGLINAIKTNDTTNLDKYITSVTDPNFAETGGELIKVGKSFYLVMGHKFTGPYTGPNAKQEYSNQIRKFNFTYADNKLSYQLVEIFTDGNRPNKTTRFHRRDLNVFHYVVPTNNTLGLGVYGGVFTDSLNGPWLNPCYLWEENAEKTNSWVDSTFNQYANIYSSAAPLIYDPTTSIMYTTFLGGITYADYKNNKWVLDRAMPFSKVISTICVQPDGSKTEWLKGGKEGLTDFIGTESHFIPLSSLCFNETEDILDMSKIKAKGTTNVHIGYVIAGIRAKSSQSSNLYPTEANRNIYKVFWSVNANKPTLSSDVFK